LGKSPRFAETTENGLTRSVTIIALTCLLVFGAATLSILGGADMPKAGPELALSAVPNAVANRQGKADRLAVAAAASLAPPQAIAPASESLRMAFAASTPSDIEALRTISPADVPRNVAPPAPPLAPEKPKLGGKPPPPKPYALLSDAQIAAIKARLKLSASQESYWPAVETALRAVAKKIHETRQADRHATGTPIDPEAAEVQQLKSAAMPLLFQLREDQKSEVRALARLIGLEQVASQI
jgi:hypothetical protein